MAIIGVLHLTSIVHLPGSTQTAGTAVLSHLSDIYPTQLHQPFHLDHRLYVSTSSLLPNSESKRTYTHTFTSSHSPQRTYISTTATLPPTTEPEDANRSKRNNGLSTISVPTTSSLESFTQLLSQKLQPQWAARQFLVLENGASLTLPIKDDAKWRISIGDLRLAQSRVSGSAAGQNRGVLIELQYEPADTVNLDSEEVKKKHEMLFRGLLKGLFKKLKLELKLDEARIHLTQASQSMTPQGTTSKEPVLNEKKQEQSHKPPGYKIAELYMEVLRGSRG